MTLITVFLTGAISPTFRKLDLQKDVEEHEKSESNIDLKKCEANAEGIELRRYYAKKSKSKEFFLEDLF